MPATPRSILARVSRPIQSVGIAIAVLLCINLSLKLWKLSEPPETDLMMYCMGGHTFLSGRVLYHDVLDQKPPGLHLIYAVGEAIGGYGDGQIAVINIAWSSALIVGLCLLAWQASGSTALVWITGGFACLGLLPNIDLEANQPNAELPINALLSFATLLALRSCAARDRLIFSLLSLMVTLIKPHAAVPCACLAFAHDLSHGRMGIRTFARSLSIPLALTIAGGWALLFLTYFLAGYFDDIWLALVLFNASYNASLAQTVREALAPFNLALLAACLAGPAALLAISKEPQDRRMCWTWVGLTAGCYFAIAAPGKWWPHYYQLLFLPLITSLISLGIAYTKVHSQTCRIAIAATVLAALGIPSTINMYRYCTLDGPAISRMKYKGDWFNETRRVAPIIRDLLRDDEWFFVWGQDPGLYVYTDIWPRTRFNTYFPFVFGQIQQFTYPLFFTEVTEHPPALVVIPRPQIPMLAPNLRDPIVNWLATNYYPLPPSRNNESHLLCVRRDSSLDMRTPARVSRAPLIEAFSRAGAARAD